MIFYEFRLLKIIILVTCTCTEYIHQSHGHTEAAWRLHQVATLELMTINGLGARTYAKTSSFLKAAQEVNFKTVFASAFAFAFPSASATASAFYIISVSTLAIVGIIPGFGKAICIRFYGQD